MPRPRVIIADDHALMAEGIQRLLAAHYDVIGICSNGRKLVEEARVKNPDIIVLDIGMPELNGIEAARQLKLWSSRVRLVFVTQQLDLDYLRAAFQAGGLGYVAKQSASTELITAVKSVYYGRPFVTPLLADTMTAVELERATTGQLPGKMVLTARQREVLQLVAEGRTVKEISSILSISPKTVEYHKSALMNELGLRTTAELTRYALARGLLLHRDT